MLAKRLPIGRKLIRQAKQVDDTDSSILLNINKTPDNGKFKATKEVGDMFK